MHDVAVGPDRVVAARVFGRVFHDAHVTSYQDFSAEVSGDRVGSVGLVGAGEMAGLLAELIAGVPAAEQVLIGLLDDLAGRNELLAALDADVRLRPAELVNTHGTVLVRLAPAAEVPDATAETVLADLRRLDPVADDQPVKEPPAGPTGRRWLRRLVGRR